MELAGKKIDRRIILAHEPRIAENSFNSTHVLTSDGDSIHGWVSGSLPKTQGAGTLFYVYVPPELRGQGIASYMVLKACGERVEYTHSSPWCVRHLGKANYNPYKGMGME